MNNSTIAAKLVVGTLCAFVGYNVLKAGVLTIVDAGIAALNK